MPKMPRPKFHYLIFCLIANSLSAQTGKLFIDTSDSVSYYWTTINIGFDPEFYSGETFENDSIIKIDTITQTQFLKYAKKYSPKINTDSSVIFKTDSSFTLKTKNFSQNYPAFRICECRDAKFLGLIAPLNLYLINTVDYHNEIAYSVFIDSKSGKQIDVPACSDSGPREVLISPKNNLLLIYDNTYYQSDNCCIFLLGINKKDRKLYTLSNYLNINLDRINIMQLVWIDEQRFVMEVTEQTDPKNYNVEDKLSYYLKITIPAY